MTQAAHTWHAQTVVLVHGLWMRGAVFLLLARRLRRRGFDVKNFSYPTVRRGLAENAAALALFLRGLDAGILHLVGHSLGGLVILKLLKELPDPRLGRAVLMGSPSNGSLCASELCRRGFSGFVGASLRDWLAAPAALGDPLLTEIGVLSGSRSLGLGRLVATLPRPNDGVVAVEETRLAAARDAITLPVGHAEMLVSERCADEVAAFLETGKFLHA